MYHSHSLSTIIPCHNEELGIAQTIKRIPKFVDETIVVDNLSTDRTAQIAKRAGVKVISEDNKGYGFAIKRGIKEAKGELVVAIDGDGTYPIEDIKEIVDYLLAQNLDFVSCARFPIRNKNSMHWQSLIGNRVVTFLMSLLFLKKFKDGLSGMWVFKKEAYEKLPNLSSGWNISEEIKIEALLHPQVKFGEYHINYHPRFGESKIWPMKVGIENIAYLFYLRFFRRRPAVPHNRSLGISLSIAQRDKLADFFITIAAGWFIAAIVSPFFELTTLSVSATILGVLSSVFFLSLAFLVIKEKNE